jgi:hypothetical protein
MQKSFCICVLAVLLVQEGSVSADDQPAGQPTVTEIQSDPLLWLLYKDREYLNSDEYLEFLKKKFMEVEPAERLGDCKSLIPQKRLKVVLADHILRHVDPDGKTPLIREDEFKNNPYSRGFMGAWSESWDVDICGRNATRGLMILKSEGSEMMAIPMVPGTLADMRLQIDTLKITLGAFRVPECDPKSRFIVGAQPIETTQFAFHLWKEAWTISRCGTAVTRTITFSPGAAPGGTQITVEVPPK